MGVIFQLRHANLMVYLTMPAGVAPRVKANELTEFLLAMRHGTHHGPAFISSSAARIERISTLFERAPRPGWEERELEAGELEESLAELKAQLSDYDFFALAVGVEHPNDEITTLAKHLAYRTGTASSGLFLIPDRSHNDDRFTVLDPLPAFAPALEQRHDWPGLLYWSHSGASAFVPLPEAEEFCARLFSIGSGDTSRLDDTLRTYRSPNRGVRLLHLSDLHYGREESAENEPLLLSELESRYDHVQRTVITGDLFDNPRRHDHVLFRNFRTALSRRSGRDAVVIPGNHDEKWLGNVPANQKQAADLEWSRLVVDDEARCVFLCFDSSRDADFARGRVSIQQLRDMAIAFDELASRRPEIRSFLHIALVHHHPFSFESKTETAVQRFLKIFGITDERFLKMEDADSFVSWLAKRGVPLILHGHKHVQRHVRKAVQIDSGPREITAIGCGTSLGAEGYALSYNLLAWDERSRTWTASFFADPGDGSGFARQSIAVHSIES